VKTDSSKRFVPLPADLRKAFVLRKLEMGADDDTFVFARSKGENPPNQENFRHRGWEPAIERAGLTEGPRITPHDARHAFASELAAYGVPVAAITEVLGHSSSQVTESTYLHAFDRAETTLAAVRAVQERRLAGG
jgi:integrase